MLLAETCDRSRVRFSDKLHSSIVRIVLEREFARKVTRKVCRAVLYCRTVIHTLEKLEECLPKRQHGLDAIEPNSAKRFVSIS